MDGETRGKKRERERREGEGERKQQWRERLLENYSSY